MLILLEGGDTYSPKMFLYLIQALSFIKKENLPAGREHRSEKSPRAPMVGLRTPIWLRGDAGKELNHPIIPKIQEHY